MQQGQPQWTVLRPDVDDISTGGERYLPQPDGSLLAQGYAPTKHRVKLSAKSDVRDIALFQLELLTDPLELRTNLLLELQFLVAVRVQFRSVKAITATVFFGAVHGNVGMFGQVIEIR